VFFLRLTQKLENWQKSGKDETLIYLSRPHPIIFSTALISLLFTWIFHYYGQHYAILQVSLPSTHYSLYAICIFFLVVMSLWLALMAFITYKTSEYAITNQRILVKTGFIRRLSLEIFLNRVEGIQVFQTVAGRVFNYGTIVIVGTGGSRDAFAYIPNPLLFRRVVQEQTLPPKKI
jgi:uncharacterized membrane protein YdbT with pleckstrin-like domain